MRIPNLNFKSVVFALAALILAVFWSSAALAAEFAAQDDDETNSIWQVLDGREDLSQFTALIAAAGLADNLDNDGPFTVFAPTDEAMAAFEALVAESDASLTDILLYHVVNGRYTGTGVADVSTLPTLFGEQLDINVDQGGITLDGTSEITTTDVDAANGVIHVIDRVLVPPVNSLLTSQKGSSAQTLEQVLRADGRFSTFLSLAEQAGLDDELSTAAHSYTIFAPVDAAFDVLTDAQFADWLTDPENIENLLTYHMAHDRLGINQIATADAVTSIEGRPLHVTVDDSNNVAINGHPLNEFNMLASNGIVHVVDAVLTP